MIEEKDLTDVKTYEKANIDRNPFLKIRNDCQLQTQQNYFIAFASALQLDLEETNGLLRKAGFALSISREFNYIIQYFF